MNTNTAAMTTILAATALLASGCAGRQMKRSSQLDAASAAAASGSATASAPSGGVDASEPMVRDDVMHPVAELKKVGFDFDSDYLGKEARATLAGNADWLKAHSALKVQVAGHCDERGTIAYNLALGQRRAEAVRDYYVMLGVSGDRVATISYGKEKPECAKHNEACWQRNRRAETLGAYEQLVGSAAIR